PARLNSSNAVVGEALRGIAQELDRLQEVVDDYRLEDVELEMALGARKSDRGVVAEHLHTDHGQRFALRRVDLSRHDRRAGLVLPKRELAQTRPRATAEEADVVGDFE